MGTRWGLLQSCSIIGLWPCWNQGAREELNENMISSFDSLPVMKVTVGALVRVGA